VDFPSLSPYSETMRLGIGGVDTAVVGQKGSKVPRDMYILIRLKEGIGIRGGGRAGFWLGDRSRGSTPGGAHVGDASSVASQEGHSDNERLGRVDNSVYVFVEFKRSVSQEKVKIEGQRKRGTKGRRARGSYTYLR